MKSAEKIRKEINASKELQQNKLEKTNFNIRDLPNAEDEVIIKSKESDVIQNGLLRDGINMLRSMFRTSVEGQAAKGKESIFTRLNKDTKKRSASFMQFRDAMAELEGLLSQIPTDGEVPVEQVTDTLLRLSECANAYYDTHRGHQFTDQGKETKKIVNEVRRLMSGCMEAICAGQEQESFLLDQSNAEKNDAGPIEEEIPKKEAKRVNSSIDKLEDAYKAWAKRLGSHEGSERKRIRDKINLFRPYESDIIKYKKLHRRSEWPYCVQQYEFYVREYNILLKLERTEQEKSKTDAYDTGTAIREHAMELDEQKEEKKLTAEEVDKDLREDQLKGVEEIDRYLIRNFENGGIMGSIAYSLKNNHSQIISELFRKTKRERLFIYYLVETGERKRPSIASVYKSQGMYTPNLEKFKNQMLATKLKLTSRITGGYIYMHKLSEAMGINKDYKEVVKECSLISGEEEDKEKQEERYQDIPEDQVKLNKAHVKRKELLKKTFRSLNSLHEAQVAYQKAEKKAEKEELKRKLEELSNTAKANMEELTNADELVDAALQEYKISHNGEKSDTRKTHENEAIVANTGYITKGVKVVAEASDTVINKTLDVTDKVFSFFGKEPITSWRLKETGLADAKFWGSAVTGPAFAGVAQLLSTMNAVYNLFANGSKMHAGDIGQNIVSILKGAGDMAVTAWGAYEKGVQFTEFASKLADTIQYTPSQALTIAGTVTASVAIGLNAYTVASSGLDYRNASNAQKYLKNKHEAKALTKEELANLSEEERAREIKKQRETRYEKSMIQLGKDLAKRNMTAGTISAAASTASLISILVPGVGLVTALIGGAISIACAIASAKMTSDLRTALFDSYFDLDNLYKKVEKMMAEKGRRIYDKKQFRYNLRMELCGAAGYADMGAAADHIGAKFADHVREKLFNDDFENEDEKNGYIQMVKSFGMVFNKEKDQPDRERLKRKMSGR